MNPLKAIRKALGRNAPRTYSSLYSQVLVQPRYHIPGEYHYADARDSAIVGAATNWLARALGEMTLRCYRGESEVRLPRPFEQPNVRHTWNNFLHQSVRQLIQHGNQVTDIFENRQGMQVIPYQSLEIDMSRVRAGGEARYRLVSWDAYGMYLDNRYLAHIMWEPNDDNAFVGVSPLSPAYAELLLDKFARDATAGRLQSPLVGVVLQPKEVDGAILPSSDKAELEKQMAQLTGTGAGRVFLGEARYDVKELQGVAHRFDYTLIYQLCEARVGAQLGVPARVSQLGAGLSQTMGLSSGMSEEIEMAYRNGAIPLAKKLAEGWSQSLLPVLGYDGYRVEFDYSNLNFESEDDKTTRLTRLMAMLEAGVINDAEFKDIARRLG